MKICYNCNDKKPKDEMTYVVENVVTGVQVAFFCSRNCLRVKLPFTKIEKNEKVNEREVKEK